jgi:subtilisin family serine protease
MRWKILALIIFLWFMHDSALSTEDIPIAETGNFSLGEGKTNADYSALNDAALYDPDSVDILFGSNDSAKPNAINMQSSFDFENALPDFSAEEANLNVSARLAAANAKEAFKRDYGLEPDSKIAVLDEGIYHSSYSDKSWWYAKLMSSGIEELYVVSTDDGSASPGWDEIEKYEQENQSNAGKVSPILSSQIKKGDAERATVIIVLKDQPDIRAIVMSSEGKFGNELNKTLNSEDSNGTEEVMQKIRNEVITSAENFNIEHGQNEVKGALDALGAEVEYTGTVRNHIIATIDVEDIDDIANLTSVQSIEPNLNCEGHLDVSTKAIHADLVWPFVQGNTYTSSADVINEVSILDSGIDCSHPATPCSGSWNYVSSYENTMDDLQGHGTHVAGIVGSRNSVYKGVSPGASLLNEKVAYRTAGGGTLSPWDAAISALQHSYSYQSEIAQYSYGWYPPGDDPPQDYDANVNGNFEISKTFDAYVEAGLTCVISAGNDGSNFSTINVPGDAYNVITVGNFDDKNTNTRFDDEVRFDSSRGNTGDGRTKPEVVAPGSDIWSANTFWEGSTNDFVQMWGTSMAAPHVSGIAALLVDQWARMYSERLSGAGFVYGGPLAIRAILYNTADETTGEYPYASFDRISGAGYVDSNIATAKADQSIIRIDPITDKSERVYWAYVLPGDRIKATITWNRHVNLPLTPTPKSVSDIDISFLDSSDNILASSSSSRNNWEKVEYTYMGSSPTYIKIRIYGFNVPADVETETVVLAYENTQPAQVALRAYNSQIVCAENGGGTNLIANRNSIDGWEFFDLVDLGFGKVALRAPNGQFVCAEGGGGGVVVANRGSIGAWETFTLEELGNDNIALRAYNTQYVCAEGGGGTVLVANRNSRGAWETFRRIRYTNSVSLQANNGQFVCAELGGGDGVVANRNSVGAWEKFRLIDLGAGYAALRAQNGQYLCAEGGGGGAVVANRGSIGGWETFQVVELGNNRIALRAANNQYLCAEGGGGGVVVANRGSIGAWETFYRTYR